MPKGFIVVVDDDPDTREMLRFFFTKKDYEVTCVENSEKVFAMIKERKPNLVLLDINMSGMNGLSSLKKLKEIDENLGVITISGNSDMDVAKEAMNLGASDYITKPFNMEYLELSVVTQIFLAES